MTGAQKPQNFFDGNHMMKVQRLPSSARRHARQDLVSMESSTIFGAFGAIYVIHRGPITD